MLYAKFLASEPMRLLATAHEAVEAKQLMQQ
jgi:hypothetical protein